MIKYASFLIILFLGCQQNWSLEEQKDFKNRCVRYHSKIQSFDEYQGFCDCMLTESMNLNLSYPQFLKMESNNLETENLLRSCIKNP